MVGDREKKEKTGKIGCFVTGALYAYDTQVERINAHIESRRCT